MGALAGHRSILADDGGLQASRPQIDAKKMSPTRRHIPKAFRYRRSMPISGKLSQQSRRPAKA
jgi:hypothetical protein